MKPRSVVLAAAIATALMASGSAFAQSATPAPAPRPAPKADVSASVAGTYAMDVTHTAIVATVFHMGFSYSKFRFGKSDAELVWDPKSPAADKLSVNIETASIMTPVEGFAAEVSDKFLKSAQFPKATFVSTKFTQSSPSKGKVDGNFTLLGVTKPISIDVTLIGAGTNRNGPVIGVSGVTKINAADYGLPAMFALQPIEITIDTEFDKKP
ncbi:MAG: YceI family protein [Alphaproteobacteria bacterium]